ncbi:hypothetical protein FACS1894139_12090 [Planctomycetales bacterium]|nr:hypothetical protein FACS1894107_08850 [Planctomycetales bacterium]GHT06385.1 hypothetical protein FACS1894139_12090 [Planctomycetales bacterium]
MSDVVEENLSPPSAPQETADALRRFAQFALTAALVVGLAALVISREFVVTPVFTPATLSALPVPRNEPLSVVAAAPHENQLDLPAAAPAETAPPPITAPVAGAYAVIYLAQQALGIVRDGEYLRVYQPVKLPTAASAIPVGDYFVVESDGRLRLNYPSPADAQKYLAEQRISDADYRSIVAAAAQKKLPAQLNPIFGAPLYIAADANPSARAITLNAPDLAELLNALPPNAPVLIR